MLNVAVLAPTRYSLYSRLVTHLVTRESGMRVTAVVVRTPWTLRRIRSEFRRDGVRLLRKVRDKLVLGDRAYDPHASDTLLALAQDSGLPGKSLPAICRQHGIPLTVVKDHNDPRALAALAAQPLDVIAFTGGGLLRRPLLEVPRLGVLNSHLGILPRFRGMDVVEWTIAEGAISDVGVGLTLHFMDKGIDTGPIVLRRVLELRQGDTIASVRSRLEPLGVQAMLDALRGLRDGTLPPQAQRAEDGRQYFVMHPRLRDYTAKCLGRACGGPDRA